jgi:hypothetical protein
MAGQASAVRASFGKCACAHRAKSRHRLAPGQLGRRACGKQDRAKNCPLDIEVHSQRLLAWLIHGVYPAIWRRDSWEMSTRRPILTTCNYPERISSSNFLTLMESARAASFRKYRSFSVKSCSGDWDI